jgi:hypothetical protein
MLVKVGKMCSIVNGMNLNCNVKIEQENLELVKEFKYLGIIIDNELNFKAHMEYVTKKVGKKVGYLRRLGGKVSMWTRIMIYNTIIKPLFEYGATVMYQSYQNEIKKLQILQNKAMRAILRCKKETHIKDMLQTLNWLSIENSIRLLVLVFIFKLKKGLMPIYLSCKIRLIKDLQTTVTRGVTNSQTERKVCKNRKWKSSVFNEGITLFDKVPLNIRNSISIRVFKKKCFEWLLNLD